MITLVKPILFAFFKSDAVKKLIIDLLSKLAQETDGPFLIHAKVVKEESVMPMVPPGASLSDTLYYSNK